MFIQMVMSKSALLFSYIFSYYIVMFFIVALFFSLNIKNIKYLSELSFYSNNGFLHAALSVGYISLAGLPPLFFFFPKFTLIAVVILQGSWFVSTCLLVLVFFGWFLYLTAVKLLSTQGWSYTTTSMQQHRYCGSYLSIFTVLLFWFFLFGWFFIDDFYIFNFWLFTL